MPICGLSLRGPVSALVLPLVLGGGVASPDLAGHDMIDLHAAAADSATPLPEGVVDIVRDPAEVPPPIGKRTPTRVRVELETREVVGRLDDGATYRYWTFNGKVPGPFIRVRVGDAVEVHLRNAADSTMQHSVDFHAVTGPGGGGKATASDPGEEKGFAFKAINPGLFIYHCATPMQAMHVSNGMYGLILVEPESGLPKVDREFYVVQGELYTEQNLGTKGEFTLDFDRLVDERPSVFTFNGAANALTGLHQLNAKTGERVRIYFGVGGPNFSSSVHVIGAIFDKVYTFGDLTSPPLTNVQTISVPAGGAVAVELALKVPGDFPILDHAMSRMEKGLVGVLHVDGPPDPTIFRPDLEKKLSPGE
jgi:nitrite reductase (NO-forming)